MDGEGGVSEKIGSDTGEEGREREKRIEKKHVLWEVKGKEWWRWYLAPSTAAANMPADRPLKLLRPNGDRGGDRFG